MVTALTNEISLRKDYLENKTLKTIYFGGGTPSLLNQNQLETIFSEITKNFTIDPDAEITLEANPDDLTAEKLQELKKTPLNRLSIGVQSFFDEDLTLMNRAHNSEMAMDAVNKAAEAGFANITIDLIYGVPGMSDERWRKNLEIAFSLPIQHLSCYSLTVEKRTALDKWIREGKVAEIDEESSISHFKILMEMAAKNNFDHYEISNFGKKGFYSRHNSSYWKNEPYLGIGPSAHSYNGTSRQWNVSGNASYILSISKNEIPAEKEILTRENKYNEYIMTGIRTQWGVDRNYIINHFGIDFESDFLMQASEFIEQGDIEISNDTYVLSQKGKLIADRIAAKLFVV